MSLRALVKRVLLPFRGCSRLAGGCAGASDDNLVFQVEDYAHQTISIPVEWCTSVYGFGFGASAWHYLASTMRQYLINRELALDESYLWRYYQCFQPANLGEAMYGPHHGKAGATDVLTRYRDPQNAPMPWVLERHIQGPYRMKQAPLGDYGPRPTDKVSARFERLISVLHAIEKDNYCRERLSSPHDSIRGVLLKYGTRFKMLIVGGNHRAAAIAALGHEQIPVEFLRDEPHFLDVEHAPDWPCVRHNYLSEAVARDLIVQYFEDNGVAKAKAWGIL